MKHILFDLDGTLLPMDQNEFTEFYLPLVARRFAEKWGTEPKVFVGAIWTGLEAMVRNDGSCTNEEAFRRCFSKLIPEDMDAMEAELLDFYGNEFNVTIQATQPTETAAKIVETAKAKGLNVYLATNPIFPECATRNRIHWAGLKEEDFLDITTYENCHYCKPNVGYFRELLEKHHLDPADCMMVGNDVEEDLAAAELGVETYLITNCMENKKGLPITADHTGSLEDLLEYLQKL